MQPAMDFSRSLIYSWCSSVQTGTFSIWFSQLRGASLPWSSLMTESWGQVWKNVFPTGGLLRLVVLPTQCEPWIRLCNDTRFYNESCDWWLAQALLCCIEITWPRLGQSHMTMKQLYTWQNESYWWINAGFLLQGQQGSSTGGFILSESLQDITAGIWLDLYDVKPEPLRGKVSGHLLNVGSHWFTLHIGTGLLHQERFVAILDYFGDWLDWSLLGSSFAGYRTFTLRCFLGSGICPSFLGGGWSFLQTGFFHMTITASRSLNT